MARSLPVYIQPSATTVTVSSAAPSSATSLSYGQSAVAIVGLTSVLQSTGGKVTITIRDGDNIATSLIIYQIELDFTSVQQSSDVQQTPIPCFGVPSYTVQADATANGKVFSFSVSLQKIAIEG
jgi:hypothetical protein